MHLLSAGRGGAISSSPARGLALVFLVLGLLACDDTKTYPGHGVVHEVSVDEGQALIAHDEMPGLMPAMTMNFSIYDPALLASLQPGDVIDFELTSQRGSFFITAAQVVGRVQPEDGWSRMGDGLVKSDPAPPFSLTDPEGVTVSLESLRGRTLLVDFIFTRCPGPCPILTSTHAAVQRSLRPELRERVRFVSITLDPLHDGPEELRAYAQARGADLAGWSFLGGTVEAVDPVLSAWGAGATRNEQGEIEHVVVSFLVDPEGRIVKRYLGTEHQPEEVVADLEAVAFAVDAEQG